MAVLADIHGDFPARDATLAHATAADLNLLAIPGALGLELELDSLGSVGISTPHTLLPTLIGVLMPVGAIRA